MNYEDLFASVTGAVERYLEHSAKRKHHQREEIQAALDAGQYFALAKERVQHPGTIPTWYAGRAYTSARYSAGSSWLSGG